MSVSDDHHVNAYNNTTTNNEKWQLNACPSIQTTTKAPWAVYGTDEIELPPIHHPITVGCQIRTPTRVAPAVAAHIRIVPVRSKTNRLLWSIAAHNQQSMRILLTNRTPEQEQNNHTTVLFTNNLSDNTTSFMVYLSIHFWAEHETSGWPTCTFNQTLSTGSIRPIMRAHDTWQCDVRWRQPNEATNVSIWIRYANLSQSILIYNTPALNGTGPKLRGLHGNVRHIMQLSCVRTKQEQALVHLFNANQIPNPVSFSYIWDIELRDGPQGLTHAFNLSQHHPTLVLQPLHEENSTLAWSYHVDSNQLVAEFPHTGQPIPVRGPRVICARCRSVYMEQLMWYGSVECHPLTEWPLIDSTAQNTSAPQPSTFMLILRQKEMPTQTVPDRIKGISTFYTLESVPYELECIVSGGLPLNETRNLSPQLWPSIHGWNVSTGTHTLVAQQSWRLSPYSRTTHIKLNPIQRIQPECRYANHSIKVIVQPVHPTGPIITDAQAVDVRTTGDPSGSPINWYCRAEGFPLPNIYWELRLHDADQHNTSEWIMLHACPASYQPNSLSDTQVCNFTTWSSELSQAEQVRCRATSHQTTVIKSLFLSELRLFASPSSILAKATHNVTRNAWGLTEARWMISLCSLILLVFATLIIISLCVYRRTRKKIEESGLHPIANALYTKPSQSVYYRRQDEADISICCKLGIESDAVRELVYLLGSVEQLFRWHIPKDCVEVTGLHLGLGHYGRVIKGWYTEPQVAPHSPVRVPVAIKTASEELSSSQCLRNEIQILPGLSEGANIARMLGLIVGTRRDLSDTYLVLEYCEHRSLAEFVRKHASQLTGTDNRAQKTSIHSCDSGVYSMNGTDLGTDPTIPKEAVSVDFTNAPHSCMTESNPSYRLTYQTLYELAWGIANGVDFLARSGIIHRDLATRNVLVDACHTPRICDFGLAVRIVRTDSETIRDESYRITSFQKQLPFRILPLEALREQTFYLASDVWELGLLFWQLFHLESKKPFVHVRSAEDLVLQLQIHFRNCTNTTAQAPPALVRPRLVDDELWYMMCRAWQADPKRRPTAQEFSTLLSIILDGMRSEKRTSGTEPVHESAHELNYITCVDLNSTDVGTDKTLQELREPEPLV
ncbi:unnamed protein product [Echinostoma caproni]|uniref:Protein kinase domain-containing protein n=1 Tax=Echinostoma caproni TaxID=27848 RepID=A0A183ADI3_9TREM|nr:unnamed protein product [Echinostoma caproni]